MQQHSGTTPAVKALVDGDMRRKKPHEVRDAMVKVFRSAATWHEGKLWILPHPPTKKEIKALERLDIRVRIRS